MTLCAFVPALHAWGHQDFPPWDSSALASRESEGHRALPAWWEQKTHPFGVGKKAKIRGKKIKGKPTDVKRRLRDFLPLSVPWG